MERERPWVQRLDRIWLGQVSTPGPNPFITVVVVVMVVVGRGAGCERW